MIFGSYPCCGGTLTLAMPDKTPAYLPEACPHCGTKVWHRLSRVETATWTEPDFLAQYDVDMEARTITAKAGTDAERFEDMNRQLGEAVKNGNVSLADAMAIASAWAIPPRIDTPTRGRSFES